MKEETLFKGSPLESEIRNAHDTKLITLRRLVKAAFENKPDSLFWIEATQMINKKK